LLINGASSMKIGELARRCDVNIDTIRYYERQGLLPLPDRQASGYRHYQIPDIARLQFVRRAKTLGFSLEEIRELLTTWGSSRQSPRRNLPTSISALQNSPESAMACIS
jgi:DNA-binding transcriptional MerR regulator